MSDLSSTAIQIAIDQLGREEQPVGSNWGHPVQDYLSRVGITFPASWCMAFVYWCFDEAAKKLSVITPLIRTAGVLHAWGEADEVNKVLTDPAPGDIFIMDFGGGLGHTGIIERRDKTYLYTIEGNTNDTGAREGFEVCRRKRLPSKMKGYLRY